MTKAINIQTHRNLENYQDLLLVLLKKEVKIRYKDKFLGYLWSIANPLSFGLVYFIVFSVIMRVKVENFPLVLMSGLFPWQWLSNSINSSPKLFIGNASIIKKINFPTNIISLAIALNHMVHYILSLPVVVVFLLVYHQLPTITWLYGVPLLLLVQLVMVYGISMLLGTLNLFVRDFERLTSIVMRFVFYLTPVVYPLNMIPEQYRDLVVCNPCAPIVLSWRFLILEGRLDSYFLGFSVLYALFFLGLGAIVYKKLSWKFAEVL